MRALVYEILPGRSYLFHCPLQCYKLRQWMSQIWMDAFDFQITTVRPNWTRYWVLQMNQMSAPPVHQLCRLRDSPLKLVILNPELHRQQICNILDTIIQMLYVPYTPLFNHLIAATHYTFKFQSLNIMTYLLYTVSNSALLNLNLGKRYLGNGVT